MLNNQSTILGVVLWGKASRKKKFNTNKMRETQVRGLHTAVVCQNCFGMHANADKGDAC